MPAIDSSLSERWFVVRHAEVEKNVRGGIGNSVTTLTPRGKQEVRRLLNQIGRRLLAEHPRLFFGDSGHVLETVAVLNQGLESTSEFDSRLGRIGLGALEGTTPEETADGLSDPYRRLQQWRDGELPISELVLPGGEVPGEFIARVLSFVESTRQLSHPSVVLVVSQSVYICLVNILTGFVRPDVYRNYSPRTSELCVVDRMSRGWEITCLAPED